MQIAPAPLVCLLNVHHFRYSVTILDQFCDLLAWCIFLKFFWRLNFIFSICRYISRLLSLYAKEKLEDNRQEEYFSPEMREGLERSSLRKTSLTLRRRSRFTASACNAGGIKSAGCGRNTAAGALFCGRRKTAETIDVRPRAFYETRLCECRCSSNAATCLIHSITDAKIRDLQKH